MIEFIEETLLLLPFLFVTYLALEAMERRAGGALGRILGRSSSVGPLAGALAGAVPQCGVSAAAASLFAGGAITAGTLLAVFLSTSDELVPVLVSSRVPAAVWGKIVLLKVAFAIVAGFAANFVLGASGPSRRTASVEELCARSHCGCHSHGHGGIFRAAAIHALQIFVFIAIVSGAIELFMHHFGEESLERLRLQTPVLGELAGAALGLVPNCAVSVASAGLYVHGAISPGALMANSFAGSGLGILVLFRTNRSMKENILVLLCVFALGAALGWIAGPVLGPCPQV